LTVLTNDKKYGAYIEAIKRKIKEENGGIKWEAQLLNVVEHYGSRFL
jgi:hypothetical protein